MGETEGGDFAFCSSGIICKLSFNFKEHNSIMETQRKFETKAGAENFARYMVKPWPTHVRNVEVETIHESAEKVSYLVTWAVIPFGSEKRKISG